MNSNIKSEKYRKLSVAALVAGILVVSLGIILLVFFLFQNPLGGVIFVIFFYCLLVLLIAAVVCGSIDLKRIQAGRYSNKGRGFDITGIVLGGIPILALLVFLLLEVIFPH